MSTLEHPSTSIFSDVHDQLRESIRSFVDREIAPHAAAWEQTTYPDAIVRRMGELGFLGLSMPEEYGGQGGDYFTNIVLAEEIARGGSGGLLMGLSVHTDMVMPPLLEFGTKEQKRRWLPAGIAGETIFALGITEPDAGSDVAAITTRAVRDGDDWVINGAKTYITNGHRAGMMLTVVKTDPDAGYDGFTTFLIPMDTPGIVLEKPLQKMGMHASDTALIALQDVRVGPEAVLGEVGRGFHQIMWELQAERAIASAGCLAYAQRAFDLTLQYALERRTFGKPLGSHQAIRHKFARMAMELEATRRLIYATAADYAAGRYNVREISMSKLKAAQVAWMVADECVQIHGGAGYVSEYPVERIMRDLRLYRIGAGADEIMLDVIAKTYGL
ncbi:acyl-CoA dehydrogenase family protein [Conexibacter arvalis]|uniref:Alkylation response protein AidB-like acyl-CoA dehydrogenase n=1 Tax=Conexibacter arvalis TaxID=912552 RepID=A0A840IFW8_9ACTN|nr:acyl-CoA dehydrogenase family protein [Conexibacter arvalis]MBB4663897.1 alkylation response protein AidB-like acyl-CoA dehydrogenase [Conexibacter arvalis]